MRMLTTLLTRCACLLLSCGLAGILVGLCAAPFSRIGPCGPGNDAGVLMLLAVPGGIAAILLGGFLNLPAFLLRRWA